MKLSLINYQSTADTPTCSPNQSYGLQSFVVFSYHLRYNLIGASGRSRPRSRGSLRCRAVLWFCSLQFCVQTVHNVEEVEVNYCKRRTSGFRSKPPISIRWRANKRFTHLTNFEGLAFYYNEYCWILFMNFFCMYGLKY